MVRLESIVVTRGEDPHRAALGLGLEREQRLGVRIGWLPERDCHFATLPGRPSRILLCPLGELLDEVLGVGHDGELGPSLLGLRSFVAFQLSQEQSKSRHVALPRPAAESRRRISVRSATSSAMKRRCFRRQGSPDRSADSRSRCSVARWTSRSRVWSSTPTTTRNSLGSGQRSSAGGSRSRVMTNG